MERLVLGPRHEVVLEPSGSTWLVTPRRSDAAAPGPDEAATEGAAEALIDLVRQYGDLADRWQVLRLASVPDVRGERPIPVDQTNTSVVVGDRVVVKWLRSLSDRPQPSLAALAQLDAVGFDRMPTAYAVLTWTSPTGRALPVAYVNEYVDGATDGWTWCVDLARAAIRQSTAVSESDADSDHWTHDFAGRLGTLAADLHMALATPNHVFPHPVQVAGAGRVQHWQDGAFAMMQRALQVSDEDTMQLLRRHAEGIAARLEEALGDDQALARTPVQHIHGDLHVGQILRNGETLAVIDFDGNPVAPATEMVQPAARDVAQLACSLRHVGAVVQRRDPELHADAVRAWVESAHLELLTAYRSALQSRAMGYLLDERLLPAFELEQELRELVYAEEHLPTWSYAPLAALEDLLQPGVG